MAMVKRMYVYNMAYNKARSMNIIKYSVLGFLFIVPAFANAGYVSGVGTDTLHVYHDLTSGAKTQNDIANGDGDTGNPWDLPEFAWSMYWGEETIRVYECPTSNTNEYNGFTGAEMEAEGCIQLGDYDGYVVEGGVWVGLGGTPPAPTGEYVFDPVVDLDDEGNVPSGSNDFQALWIYFGLLPRLLFYVFLVGALVGLFNRGLKRL